MFLFKAGAGMRLLQRSTVSDDNSGCNYRLKFLSYPLFLLIIIAVCFSCTPDGKNNSNQSGRQTVSMRLPSGVPPEITFWGMSEIHFTPDGYKPMVDLFSEHSPFSLYNTTLRLQDHPLSDTEVHDHLLKLAEYARKKNLKPTLDLDVRLDRKPFQRAYPGELQEMAKLKEVRLSPGSSVTSTVEPEKSIGDHMTFNDTKYIPVDGRLLRVYAYNRDDKEILPESILDITNECLIISAGKEGVTVEIPPQKKNGRSTACVMASFTHLSPDVFAPHLLEYQRQLVKQYADLPLAGAFKDEWGFPASYYKVLTEHRAFWYSEYYADAYEHSTEGRNLIADMLLMAYSQRGKQAQRQRAINHFMRLNLNRNAEIEDDFYNAVKETFGADAYVGKHPTWYPKICPYEYLKNGLDWWAVRRDIAQSDEETPVYARTAMAKKCNFPVWYNEWYGKSVDEYHQNLWRYVLAGGRMVYHPLEPSGGWESKSTPEARVKRYLSIVGADLMRTECRIRMLNFISSSPIDCPVAVIFGHAALVNWAGPYYDDCGADIVLGIWQTGFPVDLIPTSEIANGSLKISADGHVQYGSQQYRAAVLVNPEFEDVSTSDFFREVNPDKTAMFRLGEWTRDFNGEDIDGAALLPIKMVRFSNAESIIKSVTEYLQIIGEPEQAPIYGEAATALPGLSGSCRLTDGTWIYVSAEENLLGDSINGVFQFEGQTVKADAVGLLAVRFDPKGNLEALAAGGLRTFECSGLSIDLDGSADVALWRDDRKKWHGALQGNGTSIPAVLDEITGEWILLSVPPPPAEQ